MPVQCKTHDESGSGCFPEHCSRVIKDGVFSHEEVSALKSIAMKGYNTRESFGGPTILDINTGYIRDSNGLENLFAREGEDAIFTDEDFSVYGTIIARLRQEVMDAFSATELYFTAPTFITRLDGRKSWDPQEIHDEYWHPHVDRNNTAHYHYSGLLYLSDYQTDFKGGRIIFYNGNDNTIEQVVEPTPGRTIIFSSGHENPHKVERVTKGERLVLAFWFTCDKSRQFEIFLDGKSHNKFADKVGKSWRLQQQLNKRQEKQQEQEEEERIRRRDVAEQGEQNERAQDEL